MAITIINSALFGILLFFSLIISPTIFRVLDQRNSSLIIRALFPRIFFAGGALSASSVFATYFFENWLGVGLSCFSLFLFAVNLFYFVPAINNIRDNSVLDPILKHKRFKLLHVGSVLNYLVCMLVSFGLIFLS